MTSVLDTRAMSGFPVSIGTGLALESLFDPVQEVYDPTREVPKKENIEKYDSFFLNVRTIIRNILGSIKSSDLPQVKPEDLLRVTSDEVNFLSFFIGESGVTPIFYVPAYKHIQVRYKDKYRFPKTAKQLMLNDYTEFVLKKIALMADVVKMDSALTPIEKQTSLVFTHIPYDLLSEDKFRELVLLESHTGVFKRKHEWNTKYYPIPGYDMTLLPFKEELLVHLGDHVMFKPDPLADRIALYEKYAGKASLY